MSPGLPHLHCASRPALSPFMPISTSPAHRFCLPWPCKSQFRVVCVSSRVWIFRLFHSLLGKIIFQQPGIPGVCLVKGVGNVAEKRYQPNCEIRRNVEIHLSLDPWWEPTVNLVRLANDPESQQAVDDIAKSARHAVSNVAAPATVVLGLGRWARRQLTPG